MKLPSNFFYTNTSKYILLNKLKFKQSREIIQFSRIIINFSTRDFNLKLIVSCLLCLELITKKQSILILSKQSNIKVGIRKGSPVGCKIVIRKSEQIYIFIKKYVFYQERKKTIRKVNYNSVSFNTKYLSNLPEVENYYAFFKLIDKVNVVVSANPVRNYREFFYLLKLTKVI